MLIEKEVSLYTLRKDLDIDLICTMTKLKSNEEVKLSVLVRI